MKTLIKSLLLASLFCYNSFATDLDDWNILQLNQVYVDAMHYTFAVEPFMSGNNLFPTNALNLHTELDLFDKIGFLDTMVHSETDAYQYALVGLNYRIGAHIGNSVDLYFEHYSQHLLDTTPVNGANTYDAIGVRIYLFKRKN